MTLALLFPDVSLGAPAALLLLLLLPVLGWIEAHARRPALRLSTTAALQGLPRPLPVRLRWLMPVLRYAACVALVLALARPQRHYVQDYIESEGIDIVLALDVSGSMLAEDLQPNRLEAAKDVALGFVDARPADRIGLVIFSGESFSQCPVTIDHRAVKENLRALRVGLLEDGTAIGDGLATAVDRLRTAGKSRVVVLMTDGVNNREHISPGTALQIAKTFGVRVYTVGIGTTGTAQFPEQTPFGVVKTQQAVQLDEPLLRRIATATGGRYFRATDNASLAAIYNDIDRLEKVKVETSTETQTVELYAPLALAALVCLALEVLLRCTLFKGLRMD